MTDLDDLFDTTLASLQEFDGAAWRRILAQTHWHYQEFPFWVLVEDQSQAIAAVPILQQGLKPLQDSSENDITISFYSYQGDQEEWYGMFKGDDFFDTEQVLEDLNDSARLRERHVNVFDDAYPNDPWAIKDPPIA